MEISHRYHRKHELLILPLKFLPLEVIPREIGLIKDKMIRQMSPALLPQWYVGWLGLFLFYFREDRAHL